MARIVQHSTNQLFDSLVSHSRIALLGLMALGLAACSGGGGDGVSSYTVTPTAGAGGSISPDIVQTVNHGATTSFTLAPNTGYSIDSVGGTCGGTLDGGTYTTEAITANCTVQASFTLPAPTTWWPRQVMKRSS